MGKFQKNMALVNNRGVDVVLNRTEEPLVKLKKRSKPLKVRQLSLPQACQYQPHVCCQGTVAA